MPSSSILARTAKGAGWTVGWRVTTRLLGFVNTMILVRILVPADFGLLALATSFSQGIYQLSVLGVEEAVVRESAPTAEFYNSAFTMNLLRSLATALIICAAAWPAAVFFAEPRLFAVLLVLAFGSLATAFQNIGIVDFQRNLTFDKEFVSLIVPRLVSIVLTATLALLLRSYWALVIGAVAMQVLRTGMSYVMHPHRPCLTLRAWRGLVGFSSWSWAISMAMLVRDRVDSFVIGRILGPTPLGIYTIATDVATIPTLELSGSLGRVTYSSFAAARHSGQSVAEVYLRIVACTAVIVVPAGFGISLLADPMVWIVFGPKWLATADVVRVVGVAGVGFVLGSITSSLLMAQGSYKRAFEVSLISVLLRVVAMIVLVNLFGLIGAAAAWAVAMSGENLLYATMAMRHLHIPPATMFRAVWRIFVATAAMVLILAVSGLGWTSLAHGGPAAAEALIEGVAAGAAVYFVVLGALWYLCGCPNGAETDILELGRRVTYRITDTLVAILRRFLSPRPGRQQ
jgi:lipopolysaccharide exporter